MSSKLRVVALFIILLSSRTANGSEYEGAHVEILWPRPGHPLKELMPVVLDVALGEGRAGDLIRDNAPGLYQVREGSSDTNEKSIMKKYPETRRCDCARPHVRSREPPIRLEHPPQARWVGPPQVSPENFSLLSVR